MSSDELALLHEFEINAFGVDYEEFFDCALRVRWALENYQDLDVVFECELDALPIYARELTEDCLFLQALEVGMGLREVPLLDPAFGHHYPDAVELDGWLRACGTTLPYAGPGLTHTIEAQVAMERSLSDPGSGLSPLERHLGMSLLGLWYLVDKVTEKKDAGLRMDWILQVPERVEAVRIDILKLIAIDEVAPGRSWVTGASAARRVVAVMAGAVASLGKGKV